MKIYLLGIVFSRWIIILLYYYKHRSSGVLTTVLWHSLYSDLCMSSIHGCHHS